MIEARHITQELVDRLRVKATHRNQEWTTGTAHFSYLARDFPAAYVRQSNVNQNSIWIKMPYRFERIPATVDAQYLVTLTAKNRFQSRHGVELVIRYDDP